MSKMKSVGIDLDCTTNVMLEPWLDRYNKDYNDNITVMPKWNLQNYVKPECGPKIFDYLHEPGFFYNLDIQKDAIEVIEWLYSNYDVYIVTAYTSDVCVDKTNWIKKFLPFFDVEKIIFCNNKGLLNLDYLIDDGGHNIEAFKQTGIIYDYPHNHELDSVKYPNRVHNWKEVREFFELEADTILDKTGRIYSKGMLKREFAKYARSASHSSSIIFHPN